MAHHGYEHVDEDDDDGHVVQGKEEHPHALHHRGGVITPWKTVDVIAALFLTGVLDLYALYVHQAEHGPEQTVQGSRQTAD